MARESLDASENLPKEALRQVVPNQLENEASDMSDEARSRCGRLVRDQLRMARGRISRSRGLPRLYALSANRHRTSSPDDGLVRSGHVGEDEAHGDELFQVVLGLGSHPRGQSQDAAEYGKLRYRPSQTWRLQSCRTKDEVREPSFGHTRRGMMSQHVREQAESVLPRVRR